MTDKSLLKFLEYIKPAEDFDISKSPLEPDYLDKNNWAALPEIDGQQFYIPDNSFDVVKVNNPVDVFYIHPTGYFEKTWNSNMDKNRAACERTEIMLGNQASAFNDSCNIYAPEYRQATYYSFFDANKNGKEALDLAYSDIERAFDYFIDNFKIILSENSDLGYDDISKELDVILYPNPTRDEIYLKFNDSSFGNIQVKVFNLHGQVLEFIELNDKSSDDLRLSLSHYDQGVYFVSIQKDSYFKTLKFIIQH